MFPRPRVDIVQNTPDYETMPLIAPTGFREYDARWLFGSQLNAMGAQVLGLSIATLVHEAGVAPRIVVGHDYRSYSSAVKLALVTGLVAGGMEVLDIGLCLSPTAYFAQFALDAPCVAMVTASHNDNGWTGVKIGIDRPRTLGPAEMARLKTIALDEAGLARSGGSYRLVTGVADLYLDDLSRDVAIARPLKVVCACGNGTAGAFAPRFLERIGVEVVPLDCMLDHRFPRYNPNPEDLAMLHAMAEKVRETKADIGLAFDGDGDRCGVVDEQGREIFADKVGLLVARDLVSRHPGARFVVDVKSTGLFADDAVIAGRGGFVEYHKTGHSYIKARLHETGALAGLERSGHFFFGAPIGRGYDDGLLTARVVLEMLDRDPNATMGSLYDALPRTWSSPSLWAHCADEVKYAVIERIRSRIDALVRAGAPFADAQILDVNHVNGVRVRVADGTWGLVRASSNKPELVVVVESPVSDARMRTMFAAIDALLRAEPEVGAYHQSL